MYKVLAILLVVATAGSCNEPLDVIQVSEAMGHLIGKSLKELGVDLNVDAIVKGLQDESQGTAPSPLNDEECIQAIVELQEEKISTTAEEELEQVDAVSNGDQILENEDHPISAPNPPKYR